MDNAKTHYPNGHDLRIDQEPKFDNSKFDIVQIIDSIFPNGSGVQSKYVESIKSLLKKETNLYEIGEKDGLSLLDPINKIREIEGQYESIIEISHLFEITITQARNEASYKVEALNYEISRINHKIKQLKEEDLKNLETKFQALNQEEKIAKQKIKIAQEASKSIKRKLLEKYNKATFDKIQAFERRVEELEKIQGSIRSNSSINELKYNGQSEKEDLLEKEENIVTDRINAIQNSSKENDKSYSQNESLERSNENQNQATENRHEINTEQTANNKKHVLRDKSQDYSERNTNSSGIEQNKRDEAVAENSLNSQEKNDETESYNDPFSEILEIHDAIIHTYQNIKDDLLKEINSNPSFLQLSLYFVACIIILFGEFNLVFNVTSRTLGVDVIPGFFGKASVYFFTISIPLAFGFLFKVYLSDKIGDQKFIRNYAYRGLFVAVVALVSIAPLNALEMMPKPEEGALSTSLFNDESPSNNLNNVSDWLFQNQILFKTTFLLLLTIFLSWSGGILFAYFIHFSQSYSFYNRLIGVFPKIRNIIEPNSINIERIRKNIEITLEEKGKIKKDLESLEKELLEKRNDLGKYKALTSQDLIHGKLDFNNTLEALKKKSINGYLAGYQRGRANVIWEKEEEKLLAIEMKKQFLKYNYPSD